MAKPLKTTRADRRLKENKDIPPYSDPHRYIKNSRKVPENPSELPLLKETVIYKNGLK